MDFGIMSWYITKDKNRISKKNTLFFYEKENIEKYIVIIRLEAEKMKQIYFN